MRDKQIVSPPDAEGKVSVAQGGVSILAGLVNIDLRSGCLVKFAFGAGAGAGAADLAFGLADVHGCKFCHAGFLFKMMWVEQVFFPVDLLEFIVNVRRDLVNIGTVLQDGCIQTPKQPLHSGHVRARAGIGEG